MASQKTIYSSEAVSQIPRILGMIDRNPLSPTYGCFDKDFWHYRTIDFPSAMYQECVLPLALVYSYEFPGGETYYRNDRIKELLIAGMLYADQSSHKDGSADDYYPYERALGASCFSLYAFTESCILLDIDDKKLLDFFTKRGGWLLRHNETGKLANHQALCALCLYNIYMLTGEEEFAKGAAERIKLVLGWQSDEGWFQEYEGADVGYQTFTINFLAKYYSKSSDERVIEPLKKAINFSSYFMHPDGSYGGEYSSRNTFNFYPDGFEIMGSICPLGLQICDKFLHGIRNGKKAFIEDDRIFFHNVSNYLQAYVDYNENRQGALDDRDDFTKYFPKAGLYVRKSGGSYTVISLMKGGVIKSFLSGEHRYSDNGLAAKLKNNKLAVTHHVDNYDTKIGDKSLEVSGKFGIVKLKLPTPFTFILFRIALLTIGRFSSNLVRKLLQTMLITGKKSLPIAFKRTFTFEEQIKITDEVTYLSSSEELKIEKLFVGVDHTSIYVVMSNIYQESMLREWVDYSGYLEELNEKKHIKIERII